MIPSQKLGVDRPMTATERPTKSAAVSWANRRVDAHRQGYDEPDGDCQDAELDGNRQPFDYPLLHRPAAQQGFAEASPQENPSQPPSILHPGRHVQSQLPFKRLPVYLREGHLHPAQHDVDDIAGDEAHREKDQDAQYQQGRDDQQQSPDDIGSQATYPLSRGAGKRARKRLPAP